MSDPLDLISSYWIRKYHLRDHGFEIVSLPATELLDSGRFDLFAKLYYIRNRNVKPRLAKRVYFENLRAFVPWGKEWGKEDEKNSFKAHFKVFDGMIKRFASEDFDPAESVVLVGKDNLLLDGAHRVSTLAYYGKEVTALYFPDVAGERFPYDFFTKHGMTTHAADIATLEGVRWKKGLGVLCVWPGGEEPDLGGAEVFYRREFKIGRRSWARLHRLVDPLIDVGEDPGEVTGLVKFIFLSKVDESKFRDNRQVSFVSDRESVERLSELVLTQEGQGRWYKGGGLLFYLNMIIDRLYDYLLTEHLFHIRKKQVKGK